MAEFSSTFSIGEKKIEGDTLLQIFEVGMKESYLSPVCQLRRGEKTQVQIGFIACVNIPMFCMRGEDQFVLAWPNSRMNRSSFLPLFWFGVSKDIL